jgi:hypothetical protein
MSRDRQKENRKQFNASHRIFTYQNDADKRVHDPTPKDTYLNKRRNVMVTTTALNYETSDIALAAYLFATGIRIVEVNRRNPKRVQFVFASPESDLLEKWQAGKALVNALAFHKAYQELKQRIFAD